MSIVRKVNHRGTENTEGHGGRSIVIRHGERSFLRSKSKSNPSPEVYSSGLIALVWRMNLAFVLLAHAFVPSFFASPKKEPKKRAGQAIAPLPDR
jgi:hypothetical protein